MRIEFRIKDCNLIPQGILFTGLQLILFNTGSIITLSDKDTMSEICGRRGVAHYINFSVQLVLISTTPKEGKAILTLARIELRTLKRVKYC